MKKLFTGEFIPARLISKIGHLLKFNFIQPVKIYQIINILNTFYHKDTQSLNGFISCSSWSCVDTNKICFGTETGQLGIFDVRQLSSEPVNMNEQTSHVHDRLIRRCSFHPLNANLVSSVSEDCKLKVFKVDNECLMQQK